MVSWLLIIASLLTGCATEWIGEEYWTTVNRDGSLRGGRTKDDFLTFSAVHHNIEMRNAYVAFWITYDEQGHYETFGHAYLDYESVCARFVDRHGVNKKLCGGFRVLSRSDRGGHSNPFKFVRAEDADVERAIEYRGQQAAKIVSWQKNEAWYGSASLKDGTAQGIDFDGETVRVSHQSDPYFFNNYVFILTAMRPEEYAEMRSPPESMFDPNYISFYHTPEEERYKYYNSHGYGGRAEERDRLAPYEEDRSKFYQKK